MSNVKKTEAIDEMTFPYGQQYANDCGNIYGKINKATFVTLVFMESQSSTLRKWTVL